MEYDTECQHLLSCSESLSIYVTSYYLVSSLHASRSQKQNTQYSFYTPTGFSPCAPGSYGQTDVSVHLTADGLSPYPRVGALQLLSRWSQHVPSESSRPGALAVGELGFVAHCS